MTVRTVLRAALRGPGRADGRRWRSVFVAAAVAALAWTAPAAGPATTALAAPPAPGSPDLGPNVVVFSPDMPQSQIQATVDAIATQQVPDQFGTHRYALLFRPGTYGSAANPLVLQVGYYTTVAGLGASPGDVTINGAVDVFNQCFSGSCTALVNFWRSLSNLTINVTLPAQPPAYAPAPPGSPACQNSGEMWATSQAAPVRRVHVNGFFTLMDYCSSPSYSSGGFIADSQFTGSTMLNGSQQQFIVRNTTIDGWTNGVWNQVFSGDDGSVPPQSFGSVPAQSGGPQPYTTLATSPVTREAPFLYVDAAGAYRVFVPAVQSNSVGPTWTHGPAAGSSLPIDQFFVASPAASVTTINAALARGLNLILTPGVYHVDRTIQVRRPDTIVLGLGFPTLVPSGGVVPMTVAGVKGVKLSGLLFDAGPVSSPALLVVGGPPGVLTDPADPTSLQDVFFRIGGAGVGRAATSLVVGSDHVILDDIWAWRADHGSGVGWTSNTADTGVVVAGSGVTAYGLFVEHYQKFQVIWNGANGRIVMFQNEMPYDPPDQGSWSHDGIDGWAAIKVTDPARSFEGWGLGSYCFFNVNPSIHAAHAFEVVVGSDIHLHDLLTVSLGGVGVIDHVVNDAGGPAQGSATIPVNLVSYP
jgi:hypothetical protein